MASANLAKLQATTNRFASEAGFSPLVIDGGMGAKTIAGVMAALGDAVTSSSDIISQQARQWRDALRDASDDDVRATVIMQGVIGIDQTLTQAADLFGYPGAASVAIKPSTPPAALSTTAPSKSAFVVSPPPTMGIVDKSRLWFRQQPTTMQAGIGIGAGLLALFAFHGFRKSKKGA